MTRSTRKKEVAFYKERKQADELSYKNAGDATLKWVAEAQSLVLSDPTNPNLHSDISRLSEWWPQLREVAYALALKTVESSGGTSSTKQIALLAGRRHYGSLRDDGNPTVYDEHAIQNDIESRVSGV
jgi:hypothetical protein